MRVDSDDFVSHNYFSLSLIISGLWKSDYQAGFFNYPCGLNYNINSSIISTKIWPESAFSFCCSLYDSIDISIWKWPHDTISKYTLNNPIISTSPLWCTTVGHGNILNNNSSYFEHIRKPQDLVSNL